MLVRSSGLLSANRSHSPNGDAGPTLNQHWFNVSSNYCLIFLPAETCRAADIGTMVKEKPARMAHTVAPARIPSATNSLAENKKSKL